MTEGGILSVLRRVVEAAERLLEPHWRIVVLVHRRDLIEARRSEVLEFPDVKASWFKRVWFEWRVSGRIAKEQSADVWFAAHDITPVVDVERQYVYCHSPSCFARLTLRAGYFDWVFVVHSLLYGLFYSLNIRRNAEVFVQQAWIREQFLRRFGARSVTVSRPAPSSPVQTHAVLEAGKPLLRWIYPTFPRHFKNVEVIGRALEILERTGGWQGEVAVTIGGDENRYARWLKKRFAGVSALKFIGRQSEGDMRALYAGADALLFPSTLETWGLPITEAQACRLPMLVADLEYAHETVGNYDGATFFRPDDAEQLAGLLRGLERGTVTLGNARVPDSATVPTLVGWDALIKEICR